MIVLDASIVVELLTNGSLADRIKHHLAEANEPVIAPHLLDVEVISALRNLAIGQRIDVHRSQQFLLEIATLPVERYAHTPLLSRVWELRHNFTAYDAMYITLSEATNSTLYTSDEKLATGHKARVKVFKC